MQGLGDDGKCTVVRDHVIAANPSVLCIYLGDKASFLSAWKARSFLPPALSQFSNADADGSRGGMLTAFDPRLLNLKSSDARRFSLTTSFESTTSDVAFTVNNVYAPSDHDLTQDFVTEMVGLTAVVSGPWLIIGNFNLIRVPAEKNNNNFN
jgi:hypothetical protein